MNASRTRCVFCSPAAAVLCWFVPPAHRRHHSPPKPVPSNHSGCETSHSISLQATDECRGREAAGSQNPEKTTAKKPPTNWMDGWIDGQKVVSANCSTWEWPAGRPFITEKPTTLKMFMYIDDHNYRLRTPFHFMCSPTSREWKQAQVGLGGRGLGSILTRRPPFHLVCVLLYLLENNNHDDNNNNNKQPL